MKHILMLIIIVILISCKKEIPDGKQISPKEIDAIVEKPRITNEGKIIKFDSSKVILLNNKSLSSFYKSYHFETVWQIAKKRNVLLNVLNKSVFEGLNPKDYNFDKLINYEKKNFKTF